MSNTKKMLTMLLMLVVSFTASAADLDLEYRCISTAATTGQILGEVQITNNSSEPINLSDLTFEYYYTKEGTASETAYTDFSDITGSSYKQLTNYSTRTFNDGFIQYGFTSSAGTMAVGDKVKVQFRVHKNDWSNYDQSNDDSFDPSFGALAPYTEITVNGGAEPVNVSVRGFITDLETGEPVAHATVTIGGSTVLSQPIRLAHGHYTLPFAEAIDGQMTVKVTKNGYADYNKILTGITVEDLFLNIKLKPADAVVTIDPANYQGNEILTIDGASVKLPPLYTINEPLTVTLTSYDASNSEELLAAPGDLSAVTESGNSADLISKGMLDVKIKGTISGNDYSLSGGSYEIKIPIAGDPNSAPSTIPLWHYDESSGKWIEEGSAVKDGNVYKGTVSHFSTWNADIAFSENLIVSGNIIDSQNLPGDTYNLTVEAEGFAKAGHWTQTDFTFDIKRIPQNTVVTITVKNSRTEEISVKTFITSQNNTFDAGNFILGEYVTAAGTISNSISGHRYRVTATTTSGFTSRYFDTDNEIDIKLPIGQAVTLEVVDMSTGARASKTMTTPAITATMSFGAFTLTGSMVEADFLINGNSIPQPSVYLYPDWTIYTGFIMDGSASIFAGDLYRITISAQDMFTGVWETKVDEYINKNTRPIDSLDLEPYVGPPGSGKPIVHETPSFTGVRKLKLTVYDENGQWDAMERNFVLC